MITETKDKENYYINVSGFKFEIRLLVSNLKCSASKVFFFKVLYTQIMEKKRIFDWKSRANGKKESKKFCISP